MDSNKNNWTLGEVITLKRMLRTLKESGSTSYAQYISSRYICIREDHDGQNHEELFAGHRYCSYPFPSVKEVQEVLDIIRDDKSLLQKFEAASMHVNPDSTFWVRDTSRNMLFMRKPQFFGGRNGQLNSARDDDYHYRLSIVYFSNGSLIW